MRAQAIRQICFVCVAHLGKKAFAFRLSAQCIIGPACRDTQTNLSIPKAHMLHTQNPWQELRYLYGVFYVML